MQNGRASRTALGVAARRAAHQLLDDPLVLNDPIAVPILGNDFQLDHEKHQHPYARAFRAFMVARSRYAEDNLAEAVTNGARQYVLLGAGLDTFAYRNPFPELRVFEVDFPATQQWKRDLLREAGIAEPANLTFVPLDFEHHTLREGLTEAGFEFHQPAFFTWLGVVPYLTLKAFRATLDLIAAMPSGSGVTFDYALSDEDLSPRKRLMRAASRRASPRPASLFSSSSAPSKWTTNLSSLASITPVLIVSSNSTRKISTPATLLDAPMASRSPKRVLASWPRRGFR